jgi:hypothetical protein
MSDLNEIREGLTAAQRVRELEARLAAKDLEIVALELAIADRDHRIKALLFEISARSAAAAAYSRT